MITTIGKFRNSTASITILIETYIREMIYIDYKGSDPTEKNRTMRPVIVRKKPLRSPLLFNMIQQRNDETPCLKHQHENKVVLHHHHLLLEDRSSKIFVPC
jgi:hypothetical protein